MIRRLRFEWRYLRRHAPWDTGLSPPELLAALDRLPPGRSLDLGCGTGTNMRTMAEGGWEVTGIDFSSRAVKQARRKLQPYAGRVTVILGDVTRLPGVSGPFDLALDLGCFHSLPPDSRRSYAANLGRWLRPGATYLLYSFF